MPGQFIDAPTPDGGKFIDAPAPPSASPSGGKYDYNSVRSLLLKVGAKPQEADFLAHIPEGESSYDPNATGVNYTDHGGTYHAEGLFQISTVHGLKNMHDPEANARAALNLYRSDGTEPWDASKASWGKYLAQKTSDPKFIDAPGPGEQKAQPLQKLPPGGMAAVLHATPHSQGPTGSPPTGLEAMLGHPPPAQHPAQPPPPQVASHPTPAPGPSPHTALAGTNLGAVPAGHRVDQMRDFVSNAKDMFEHSPPIDMANRAIHSAQAEAIFGFARQPIETFANVEGTPGRAVMSFLGSESAKTGHIKLKDIGAALRETVHPEDTQELTDHLEHTYAQQLHLPTRLDPSTWHEDTFQKLVADVLFQTATDPLTYVGVGDIAKAVGLLPKVMAKSSIGIAAGNEALKFLQSVGKNQHIGDILDKLAGATADTRAWGKSVGKNIHDAVKRRPDLDEHFLPEAAKARMAMEAVSDYATTGIEKRDAAMYERLGPDIKKNPGLNVAAHPEVMKARLQDMYRYGDAAARATARSHGYVETAEDLKRFPNALGYLKYNGTALDFSDLKHAVPKKGDLREAWEIVTNPTVPRRIGLNLKPRLATPLEQMQARSLLSRELINRRQTAHLTADYVAQYGGLKYTPKARKSNMVDYLDQTIKRPSTFKLGAWNPVARGLAGVWRQGILIWPFPHVYNIHGITQMRGGVTTAAQGLNFSRMLWQKSSNPHLDELVTRLMERGGTTSYWRTPAGISQLAPLKHWVPWASEILEHAELGHRAAYLEMLDKLDGTHGLDMASRDLDHEYQKMAQAYNDIGNYRDMTLLVQFFHGLGGVFAQYGADIAPRAAWNDIGRAGLFSSDKQMRHLPIASGYARTQRDLNDPERDIVPGGEEIELSGPALGGIRAATDPHYWASAARIGPIGSQAVHGAVSALSGKAYGEDLGQAMGSMAEAAIPGLGMVQQIPGLEGLNPFSESDDAPVWMRMWFLLNGGYLRSTTTTKSSIRAKRTFDRYSPELELP